MNPANRPGLVGSYDFDLLGQGVGKGCVTRGLDAVYWVGMNDVASLSDDPLTRQAIAAAMLDAVERLEDADSILLTSVFTESKESGRQVCATVAGRGIRIKKADEKQRTPAEVIETPVPPTPDAGSK